MWLWQNNFNNDFRVANLHGLVGSCMVYGVWE